MVTIFSIPKPFMGHINTIQINAIKSWILLQPKCEIILCGNDHRVSAVAEELDLKHIPDIATTEFGTPLISSAFEIVSEVAKNNIIGYINSDIILLNNIMHAVERVKKHEYVLVGRRCNLQINDFLDFENPDWEKNLRKLVHEQGKLYSAAGIDYIFFTPNGKLENLPPFAVGRPKWDNWFIYNARRLGVPVIDATRVVTAIHQDHDHSHIPQKTTGSTWEGPEAKRNRMIIDQYLDHREYTFNIWDATHILTSNTIIPAIYPVYIRQLILSTAALHPRSKPFIELLYPILRPPHRIKKYLKDRYN